MKDIFSPDLYEATRRPLERASPLPGWCYSSPAWYEREIDTIFRGANAEWLCVGRVDQIPKPGDFYTIELLGHPLIVVRDQKGVVRVHHGVCRHRAALLVDKPHSTGRCSSFVCPYHSWTYDLTGRLRATPGVPAPMECTEDFNRDDYGLTSPQTDFWGGFIFVTMNPNPRPLAEWLGELPKFLQNYSIEEMQFTHRDVFDVECNWKVWLENAFENYHTSTVHRAYMSDPKKPPVWTFEECAGPFEAVYSQGAIIPHSGLPKLESLDEKQSSGLYHVWLQPTLQIIITATYMKYRQYLPKGPGQLTLIENWCFPKPAIAHPEFERIAQEVYYQKYGGIIEEDLRIAPVVQRGLASGVYKPGRYSVEEFLVHKVALYVLDRVLGPQDGAAQVRGIKQATASIGR